MICNESKSHSLKQNKKIMSANLISIMMLYFEFECDSINNLQTYTRLIARKYFNNFLISN